MGNRLVADAGAGFRGNTASFDANASASQRGGHGMETAPPSEGPHSSRGFRRALERTQRNSSRLKDEMPDKVTFGGPGYKKPNYFAQGGRRHGMHISTGAPHTSGGQQDGADVGGN
jgi:hypothetical protein